MPLHDLARHEKAKKLAMMEESDYEEGDDYDGDWYEIRLRRLRKKHGRRRERDRLSKVGSPGREEARGGIERWRNS